MGSARGLALSPIASAAAWDEVAPPRRTTRDRRSDQPSDQTTQHGAERRPSAILLSIVLLSKAWIDQPDQGCQGYSQS